MRYLAWKKGLDNRYVSQPCHPRPTPNSRRYTTTTRDRRLRTRTQMIVRCKAEELATRLDVAVCDHAASLDEVERLIQLHTEALRELKLLQQATLMAPGDA